MATEVNYFIFWGLFVLLEVAELTEGVSFLDFDPDDEADVRRIAVNYFLPPLKQASVKRQLEIQATIAFYARSGDPPFQMLRDRCQELTLSDPSSWRLFFLWVERALFGCAADGRLSFQNVTECPNEESGFYAFG
ncbi:MAG: hypothetical protein R3C01_08145 [Planctomycetaceae bacterium]